MKKAPLEANEVEEMRQLLLAQAERAANGQTHESREDQQKFNNRLVRLRVRSDDTYREEFLSKQRARAKRIKLQVIIAYGGMCACCGESNEIFLALDHVANDGGQHRKEISKSTLWRWARSNGYPKTLQLLCMNCNWAKYNNDGVCPHQQTVLQLVTV